MPNSKPKQPGLQPADMSAGSLTGSLAGKLIAVTAERRVEHQVRYLKARGADVFHAPVLRTLDARDHEPLLVATDQIIAEPVSAVVVQTGQGFKWWLDGAHSSGRGEQLLASLATTRFICRGAKASVAVRHAGFDVAWQAEGETVAEVADYLASQDLNGQRVALQHDGNRGLITGEVDQACVSAAVAAGASVVNLDVYRYAFPEDLAPARRLVEMVIEGKVEAVTFTASPAIRQLRQIADERGRLEELDSAFSGQCLAVVVGPVCAETAREADWTRLAEPATARLIPMLDVLVDNLLGTPADGQS